MSTSLCQLARNWTGEVPTGGLSWEQKHDGFRCLRFHGIDGKARLFTRNGMPIEGCAHIAYWLGLIEEAAGERLFIDGELVVDGSLAATKQWVESGWRKGGEAGVFYAFDVVPYREWVKGGWDAPQHERKAMLKRWIAEVGDPWDWRPGSRGRDDGATPIILAEEGWAFDARDALDEARRMWSRGLEGIMLKDPLAPYRRNRNAAWQKVKQANAHYWKEAA